MHLIRNAAAGFLLCLLGTPTGCAPTDEEGQWTDRLADAESVASTTSALAGRRDFAVFNDPTGSQSQQRAIVNRLKTLIDNAAAGSWIRIGMYHWTNSSVGWLIADALRAAMVNRGIRLGVIADGDCALGTDNGGAAKCAGSSDLPLGSLSPTQSAICNGGGNGGTACISNNPDGIQHEKYFLFQKTKDQDGSSMENVVAVTSENLTGNGATGQWQNMYVSYGTDSFATEWYGEWIDHFLDQLNQFKFPNNNYYAAAPLPYTGGLTGYVSPRTDGGDIVVSILNNIEPSQGCFVYFNQDHFNRPAVTNVLRTLSSKCLVGLLYSESNSDAEAKRLETAVTGNQVKKYAPAGIVTHNKYFVIYAKYAGSSNLRRLVFTGSHNLTQNASSVHDENLVKIDGDWNGGARSTTWTDYYLHFNKMWNLAASRPVL